MGSIYRNGEEIRRNYNKNMEKVTEAYKNAKKQITGVDFWDGYLR